MPRKIGHRIFIWLRMYGQRVGGSVPDAPCSLAFYKYPPLRSKKIHPVSVRAESSVVAAMQLDVSTPSWPIFFAMT